jgi:hemerythrin-like domain-containing protein
MGAVAAGLSAATGLRPSNRAAGAEPDRTQPGPAKPAQGKTAEEVSPGEDLMREHGVLKRILLIYGEVIRRIDAKEGVGSTRPLVDAAGIVRAFVEDYHEKLEEDFLFPRFKKAGRLVELVDTLAAQHLAGRRLTDTILRLATVKFLGVDDSRALAAALGQFIRMYGPHHAREDTILFPAFHDLVSQREYDALGERFEDRENERFGPNGFEKTVERVAGIEKTLGIYDLAQFTPRG